MTFDEMVRSRIKEYEGEIQKKVRDTARKLANTHMVMVEDFAVKAHFQYEPGSEILLFADHTTSNLVLYLWKDQKLNDELIKFKGGEEYEGFSCPEKKVFWKEYNAVWESYGVDISAMDGVTIPIF